MSVVTFDYTQKGKFEKNTNNYNSIDYYNNFSNKLNEKIKEKTINPCDTICHIYVSSTGNSQSPFYEFYYNNNKINNLELDTSKQYTFHRLNNDTNDPFFVTTNSDLSYSNKITIIGDGSLATGISGSETFILKFNSNISNNDKLYLFSTSNSSKVENFNLTSSKKSISNNYVENPKTTSNIIWSNGKPLFPTSSSEHTEQLIINNITSTCTPCSNYTKSWHNQSDRKVAAIVTRNIPRQSNSLKTTITSSKPTGMSAAGEGVDIKYGSYQRHLSKKKMF